MISAYRSFLGSRLGLAISAAIVLPSGLLAACDAGEGVRAEWLHNVVVLDNQVFLETEPALASGKLAKMDLDLYAYFRGSAGCYARDLAQAGGPGYLPTDYLSEDAADVALIGDPHLENIGSYRRSSDGLLVIDFNDFDAATYGPFHFDVRRLALSAAIASMSIERVDPGFAEASAEAPRVLVRAYVDEIHRLSGLEKAPGSLSEEDGDLGLILGDLVKKARAKGDDREALGDYTEIVDGERHLVIGEIDPAFEWSGGGYQQVVYDDAIRAVDSEERSLITSVLLDTYPGTVADSSALGVTAETLEIKGVGRRLGAGVASYPVRRYYVLVEGPSPSIADDWLLELKQVFDPLVVPGLEQAAGGRPYADNGERVVAMQRALQGAEDHDSLLGYGFAGGLTMRVRERTKYQRGVGIDRIAKKSAEGKWSAADYLDLVRWSGRLLARAHARAPKRDGTLGLPALAEVLAGEERGDGFVDETVAFVDAYAPVVEGDAERFSELLADYGPSLGYVRR
ncbi:MAG TPA: DUF2252 domain-containing protein [Nannocystis exedens]|nr:DUF2252 domain-containing protein [Nannocystis exedens]